MDGMSAQWSSRGEWEQSAQLRDMNGMRKFIEAQYSHSNLRPFTVVVRSLVDPTELYIKMKWQNHQEGNENGQLNPEEEEYKKGVKLTNVLPGVSATGLQITNRYTRKGQRGWRESWSWNKHIYGGVPWEPHYKAHDEHTIKYQ